MSEMTITVRASRYRIAFGQIFDPIFVGQTDDAGHPFEGYVAAGDVVDAPEHFMAPYVSDGMAVKVSPETPTNKAPRGEPSKIIGINYSEAAYKLEQERLAQEGLPGAQMEQYMKDNLPEAAALHKARREGK